MTYDANVGGCAIAWHIETVGKVAATLEVGHISNGTPPPHPQVQQQGIPAREEGRIPRCDQQVIVEHRSFKEPAQAGFFHDASFFEISFNQKKKEPHKEALS